MNYEKISGFFKSSNGVNNTAYYIYVPTNAKIKGVVEVIEVVIGYGVKIIGIAKNHIVKAVILQKCHPFNA